MLDEIKLLEPQLKQIVYGCVEHVQATKAALYLSASLDLNEKIYEMATGYQFHDPMRRTVKANDALVDPLIVKRNAFFVNGLATDQRLSEMLFRQGTDRLLATPLFSRGRLLGFLDLRDREAKKPFENPDIEAARRIADQIVELLSSKNLFGLAPIPLSAAPDASSPRLNTPMPFSAPPAVPASASAESQSELSPAARKAIEARVRLDPKRVRHPQLDREHHRVALGDERRAVVDEEIAAHVLGLKIHGRLPVDLLERLCRHARDRGVLRVAAVRGPCRARRRGAGEEQRGRERQGRGRQRAA